MTKPTCAKCGSDEFCQEVLLVKKAVYRVTEEGAQEIQAYEEELPQAEGGRRVCTCRKCNFEGDFDAFERWVLQSWGEAPQQPTTRQLTGGGNTPSTPPLTPPSPDKHKDSAPVDGDGERD